MALTFVTFYWGDKYPLDHVRRLAAGVKRNVSQSYRFIVLTDIEYSLKGDGIEVGAIPDLDLIGRGCFCRLRLFDPEWQKRNHIVDRIVSIDLDVLPVRRIDNLFEGPSTFKILRGVNAANPNPYNGSLWMLRPGEHSDIWSDFTPAKAKEIKFHEFPDDQGWFWHKMGDHADGWEGGSSSGIYAFQKPGWPKGSTDLPADAKMVAFFGWRKPEAFSGLKWVRDNWRLGN